jgi:hypothetical protein
VLVSNVRLCGEWFGGSSGTWYSCDLKWVRHESCQMQYQSGYESCSHCQDIEIGVYTSRSNEEYLDNTDRRERSNGTHVWLVVAYGLAKPVLLALDMFTHYLLYPSILLFVTQNTMEFRLWASNE